MRLFPFINNFPDIEAFQLLQDFSNLMHVDITKKQQQAINNDAAKPIVQSLRKPI